MTTKETTKIYHNPRCSKSRQTLQLLTERGEEPEVIEYLKTPPDVTEVTELLEKLKMSPLELVRKGEDVYKDTDFANQSTDDQIKLMVTHPILIERPIVVRGSRALIGRPPESVLMLLD